MKYKDFSIRFQAGVIIICLPFLLIFATIFVMNNELAYGIISGKYFWFYGCLGLVGLITSITVIFGKKHFHFSILDLLLLLFVGSVYFSALVFNDASQNTTKLTLLALLTVLYFGFRVILNGINRLFIQHLFCISIVITGLMEAIWGFMQLHELAPSQHNLFKLTGSLLNPGPYGGYLAVVFPVALYYCLHGLQSGIRMVTLAVKWLSGITCFAIILVLPAAMSRASWLALISGSLVVVFMYYSKRFSLKEYYLRYRRLIRIIGSVAILLLFVSFVGMYILKKNSADGRVLTWKISMQSIIKHPLGVGLGNFSGAYGEEQAAYFASGKANATEELVAGNPEYGFNEYLQIMLESGIVSFLLFMTIIVLAFRLMKRKRNWGIVGALISLLVFAFFSYPFSMLPFLIILVFLLATSVPDADDSNNPHRLPFILVSCLCLFVSCFCCYERFSVYNAYKKWNQCSAYYYSESYNEAVSDYETLYPLLNDQTLFLFEYSQVLSKTEKYAKSNEVLQRAMQISCDPMLYNIMGKNYQAMKEYNQAEAAFRKAANLVPSRLYPWYLLTKLYDEMGLKDKVLETATIVQTKEVKIQSPAVDEMREEVEKIITKN
jgi:tetratricopeptide (TPR) repeat protein